MKKAFESVRQRFYHAVTLISARGKVRRVGSTTNDKTGFFGELLHLKPLRVLLLCGLLLCFLNYFSTVCRLAYWQPDYNSDALRVFAYQHTGEPYEVLFIGSSHVARGILSKTVEKELERLSGHKTPVFNLGQGVSNILTDYFVFRDTLDNGRKPRIVIMELSVASLNAHNYATETALKYYASQADIVRLLPGFRSSKEFYAALFGMFRGLNSFMNELFNRPGGQERAHLIAEIVANGGGHMYKSTGDAFDSVALRSGAELETIKSTKTHNFRRNMLKDYEIGGDSDWAMSKIISLAEKSGIKLILINMPVTDEFMDIYGDEDCAAYGNYVEHLRRDNGVEIHNMAWGKVGLTRHDFSDLDHLNKRGAEKLSRYLAGIILESDRGTSQRGIAATSIPWAR